MSKAIDYLARLEERCEKLGDKLPAWLVALVTAAITIFFLVLGGILAWECIP